MLRKVSLGTAAVTLCFSFAMADFQYKETTKLEGGMLGGVVKFMGRLGGQKLDEVNSTIYIRGDRLRREDQNHIQLIRVDKEDFVDINPKEKTYTILTFEQLRAQIDEATRKMQERKQGDSKTSVNLKYDLNDTGKTLTIAGYPAREYIMDVRMQAEDKEKNQSGEMVMNGSIWLASGVSGSDQARDFYRKFAQKFGRVFAGPTQAMGSNPQFAEAMQKFAAKAHALEGTALLTVISFSAVGDPNAQAQSQQPQAKEGESSPVPNLGKIFGGFGRKKKEEKKAESQPESSAQPPAGGVVLFKSRSESRDFSTSSVDASLFEIPSGYKQVSK